MIFMLIFLISAEPINLAKTKEKETESSNLGIGVLKLFYYSCRDFEKLINSYFVNNRPFEFLGLQLLQEKCVLNFKQHKL